MRGARAQRDGDPAGVSRLGWDSLGVCAHPTPSSCWGTGTPPPESTQAGHLQEASACLPGWGWGGAAVRSPRGGAGGGRTQAFSRGPPVGDRVVGCEWVEGPGDSGDSCEVGTLHGEQTCALGRVALSFPEFPPM